MKESSMCMPRDTTESYQLATRCGSVKVRQCHDELESPLTNSGVALTPPLNRKGHHEIDWMDGSNSLEVEPSATLNAALSSGLKVRGKERHCGQRTVRLPCMMDPVRYVHFIAGLCNVARACTLHVDLDQLARIDDGIFVACLHPLFSIPWQSLRTKRPSLVAAFAAHFARLEMAPRMSGHGQRSLAAASVQSPAIPRPLSFTPLRVEKSPP